MPVTEMQVIERVRDFLTENFLYMRPDFVLNEGDSLLETGVIDSRGVLEVLNVLEEEFGVTAADEEVSEANLGSLRAIAQFVAGKRAAAAA